MTHMEPETASPPVWTARVRLGSSDVDFTRRATSLTLCRHFLEAAWNHAEALGVGFHALGQHGRFWVLSRLRIEALRYPEWGSAVVLRTWPRPVQSVFAMRDFDVRDEAGGRLAAGASAWLVLEAASKRPQRLHRVLPGIAGWDGASALGRDPEKLADEGPWDAAYSTAVRYTDIDVNQHVTSSRYLGWILDSYPVEFHLDHEVQAIEVNYLGETLAGDELEVRTRQLGSAVRAHSLVKVGGEEVCRARVEWRERPASHLAKCAGLS